MNPFYCFFRVPINPPSTIRMAKTIPASGAPVFRIPIVLVVAAFVSGVSMLLIEREFTPLLLMLKVFELIEAVKRYSPGAVVHPVMYK